MVKRGGLDDNCSFLVYLEIVPVRCMSRSLHVPFIVVWTVEDLALHFYLATSQQLLKLFVRTNCLSDSSLPPLGHVETHMPSFGSIICHKLGGEVIWEAERD